MKKPSKSPTVLLKQKVKERILTKCAGKVGKSEGPSTTSGEEIPANSDVPPAVDLNKEAERLMESLDKAGLKEDFLNPKPESYMPKLGPFPEGMGWNYEPHPARTICPKCGCLMDFSGTQHPDGSITGIVAKCPFCRHSTETHGSAVTKRLLSGTDNGTTTFLPVENHGSTNDLARSVISKVKSARPASDLDRLERSQLRGKP